MWENDALHMKITTTSLLLLLFDYAILQGQRQSSDVVRTSIRGESIIYRIRRIPTDDDPARGPLGIHTTAGHAIRVARMHFPIMSKKKRKKREREQTRVFRPSVSLFALLDQVSINDAGGSGGNSP